MVGRIHSFDRFVVGSKGMAETIVAQTGERIKIGGSYLPIYERHLAPYRQLVRIHQKDFAEASWDAQSIELLLVDISKTLDLNRKIVELFFPRLIPGVSLVIHQDYFHYGQPWIHITMEYLSEYFENDPEKVDDTSVFRCLKAIPTPAIEALVRYDFTRNEQLSMMSQAIERSSKSARPYLELNNCMLIRSLLGEAAFVSQVSKIASSYKSFDDRYHWKKYLGRVVAMTTASSASYGNETGHRLRSFL